jgi:hypothetical protein
MKKYIVFGFVTMFVINLYQLYSQEDWEMVKGVWNPDLLEKPIIMKYGNKKYWGCYTSIFISSNKDTKLTIQAAGKGFRIDKIIGEYPDITLTTNDVLYENYKPDGRFIVHFIDTDNIWFEEKFPEEIFKKYVSGAYINYGKEHIYKRAKEAK